MYCHKKAKCQNARGDAVQLAEDKNISRRKLQNQ